MKNFIRNNDANVAVIFAAMAVPFLGMVGLAIDFARINNVQSYLQDQADIASIAGAKAGEKTSPDKLVQELIDTVGKRYGSGDLTGPVTASAKWNSPTEFQIDVSGTFNVMIVDILPGARKVSDVNVTSIVHLEPQKSEPGKPEKIVLENDAQDYNRLHAYCFNPESFQRTKMTPIQDNAGTVYNEPFPECEDGEFVSYMLKNVRDGLEDPSKWDGFGIERYTDTVIKEDGVPDFTGNVLGPTGKYLETIMCDNAKECQPVSKGGIIPEGTYRTPRKNTKACAPGKYLYYGWEDRGKGNWGDDDFNDIRFVVPCGAGTGEDLPPKIWIAR